MSLVRGLALAALPFCVLQPFPDRGLFLRCGPARLHQGQEVGFVHLVQEVDGPRPLVVPVDDEIEHIAALGLHGDEPFYHLILGRKKAGYLFQISCSVCRCVSGGYLVVVIYQLEKSKLKTSIFFEFVSSGIPFASINFVSFHIIDD